MIDDYEERYLMPAAAYAQSFGNSTSDSEPSSTATPTIQIDDPNILLKTRPSDVPEGSGFDYVLLGRPDLVHSPIGRLRHFS